MGYGGTLCTWFFYLSNHVFSKLYEDINRKHGTWIKRSGTKKHEIGQFEVVTRLKNNELTFEYIDRSIKIEKNIRKMLHITAKNGSYNLTELKQLYICEFYDYYRFVEDELKAKQ